MIYGLYLSAAGALAESRRHSVISNNIANITTPGFKADVAVFAEREAEAVEGRHGGYATPMDAIGGGLLLGKTYTRHDQGPIHITGNEFDFAIYGDGFFAVTDGSDTYYTRAGAFMRDAGGRLATPDGGHFLADGSGRPVVVPLDGEITVAHDGTISANGGSVGKIQTFTFPDKTVLTKKGENLYRAGGGQPQQGTGQIRHKAIETSAASPVEELSRMLLAMRGYEANMQMIRMQDQTLSDLVGLGRVSL